MTGSVLAAGRITDSNGLPASDVPVAAYAYPADIPGEVGAEFELTEVGTAVTDRSGNYQIRTNTSALRSAATEVSAALGMVGAAPVNVDIVAGTSDASTAFSTTIWATPDLGQAHVVAADLPAATALTNENAGVAEIQNAVGASAVAGGPRIDMALDAGVQMQPAAVTSASVPARCRVQENYGKRGVTLAQLSATVTTGGFSQRFSYTTAGSTTLGVGVQLANGTFTASGSNTVGSEATITYPAQSSQSSKSMRTNFIYAKLRCTPAMVVPRVITKVQAIEHTGGTAVTSSTTPRATYCDTYYAGSTFTKQTSTATTFSAGASTKGIIGINLSARTGYSTSAKVSISLTKDRDLCGTNGYAPNTPGRLVVRPVGSS